MIFVSMDGERELSDILDIIEHKQEDVWLAISEDRYKSIIEETSHALDGVRQVVIAETADMAEKIMREYALNKKGFLRKARKSGLGMTIHYSAKNALDRINALNQGTPVRNCLSMA